MRPVRPANDDGRAWLTRGATLLELRPDGTVAVPRPGRAPVVHPNLRAFLRAAPASNHHES